MKTTSPKSEWKVRQEFGSTVLRVLHVEGKSDPSRVNVVLLYCLLAFSYISSLSGELVDGRFSFSLPELTPTLTLSSKIRSKAGRILAE